MTSSIVTEDGLVTLPQHVLDQLGIGPGDEVQFRRRTDGSVVLEKAKNADANTRLADLVGIAGPGMPTDELMALLRGD